MVFILADDQRWDCMSCAGHPVLKTPNMDRLAAEGARFTNAFSTTALCSPARASFLSGLYGHTHGVINNFTDNPKDLPSFPRQLQAASYEIAYLGKFHMGEQFDEARPGFDLADPTLHLLTCDTGFKRAIDSPQANRVHIASAEALRAPDNAIKVLRSIVESA